MKLIKDFSRIALVAALACSFALTSCKKEDEENCADLLKNIAARSQEQDGSVEKCNALKAAMQAYVDASCEGADVYKTQLESGAYDCD